MTSKPPYLLLPKSLLDPATTEQIESSGSIVIIGANGTGKSRLGSWIEFNSEQKPLVHRISAQKSLELPLYATTSSTDRALAKLYYGYEQGFFDHKIGHRWQGKPSTVLLNDFQILLEYLFTEEFEVSTKYRQDAKE